jgi:hypothetical protein
MATAMMAKAKLDTPDGSHFEKVRVVYSETEAYALDSRGRKVWEAALSGFEKQGKDVVLLSLAAPAGAVARAEKSCGCRG